jgi:translation initiation factor 2B subunit (eIF-2B alpha/beta/delta family)
MSTSQCKCTVCDWFHGGTDDWIKMRQGSDGVDWTKMSYCSNAISVLEQHIDDVDWHALSQNTSAIHMLEKNLDKVCWTALSGNPKAIHIIEENLDKVNWDLLSRNPKAIHILEKNPDKVDLIMLSSISTRTCIHYQPTQDECNKANVLAKEVMTYKDSSN